eukprot:TRINITY_DN5708_c0_g1_i1.p1 TRINITY_DN5708_c0_g1~~TRINITY_DN5708_c0_g1_i1.p1  ORF type:complete len:580 (+),score=140.14 TRINITY_DN5708_c0_g1_i1:2-1741(+)
MWRLFVSLLVYVIFWILCQYLFVCFDFFFFFSSRRRHTRSCLVSWARRCVQETGYQRRVHGKEKKKNSEIKISIYNQQMEQDSPQNNKNDRREHEKYNVPESYFKEGIEKTYDAIHDNIEEINQNLLELFRKKEKELQDMYKNEMYKAQQQLQKLSESTSEQELKKRMIEKKEKLQKERQKFLESSIYFSNKCKEFKTILNNVVNTAKDLENEIQFLNEQIVYADKHNNKLKSELEQLKVQIKQYDPDCNVDNMEEVIQLPNKNKMHKDLVNIRCNSLQSKKPFNVHQMQEQQQFQYKNQQFLQPSSINPNSISIQNQIPQQQSQLQWQQPIQLTKNSKIINKYISPYSQKSQLYANQSVDNQDLQKAKEELRKQKEIYEKLNEFLNDPCFQETEFEKIFMESVLAVRSRRQSTNSSVINKNEKLPVISKEASFKEQGSEMSSKGKISESTLDFTSISDFEFNDFVKRQILEEFLSREEIKRYLYTLIFNPQIPANEAQGQNSAINQNQQIFDQSSIAGQQQKEHELQIQDDLLDDKQSMLQQQQLLQEQILNSTSNNNNQQSKSTNNQQILQQNQQHK